MGKIIRLPSREHCVDCGKPLEDGEGKVCSVKGCGARGCAFCAEQSDMCSDHLKLAADD